MPCVPELTLTTTVNLGSPDPVAPGIPYLQALFLASA